MLESLLKAALLLVAWGILTAGDILEEGRRFDNLNNETFINNSSRTIDNAFDNHTSDIKFTRKNSGNNQIDENNNTVLSHANIYQDVKKLDVDVNYTAKPEFVLNISNVIEHERNNDNNRKDKKNDAVHKKQNVAEKEIQHILPTTDLVTQNRSQNEYLFHLQIEEELRKTNNISHIFAKINKERQQKKYSDLSELGKITFQYHIIKKNKNKTRDSLQKQNDKNKSDTFHTNFTNKKGAHGNKAEHTKDGEILLATRKIDKSNLFEALSLPVHPKKVTETYQQYLIPSKMKRTLEVIDISIVLITDQCNMSINNHVEAINLKESLNSWCLLNGLQLKKRIQFLVNNGES